MTFELKRRAFLQLIMGTATTIGASARFAGALAAASDAATIGWPNDVPTWILINVLRRMPSRS